MGMTIGITSYNTLYINYLISITQQRYYAWATA